LSVKLLENAIVRSAKIFTSIYVQIYRQMHGLNNTRLLLEVRFHPLILGGLMNMVTKFGAIIPIDKQLLEKPCFTALMRSNFFDPALTKEVFMERWKSSMFYNEDIVEVALTEEMFTCFKQSVQESLSNYEWTNIPTMMTIVAHLLIHSHLSGQTDPLIMLEKTENLKVGGSDIKYKEDILFLTKNGNIRREVLRKNMDGQQNEKALVERARKQVVLLCQDARPRFIIPKKHCASSDSEVVELEDLPMMFMPSSKQCPLKSNSLSEIENIVSKMSFYRHILSIWSRDKYLNDLFNDADSMKNYYENGETKQKEDKRKSLETPVVEKPKGKRGRKSKKRKRGEGEETEEDEDVDDGEGGDKIKLTLDQENGYSHEQLQKASRMELAKYAKTAHNAYKMLKADKQKLKARITELKARPSEDAKRMEQLEKEVKKWKKEAELSKECSNAETAVLVEKAVREMQAKHNAELSKMRNQHEEKVNKDKKLYQSQTKIIEKIRKDFLQLKGELKEEKASHKTLYEPIEGEDFESR